MQGIHSTMGILHISKPEVNLKAFIQFYGLPTTHKTTKSTINKGQFYYLQIAWIHGMLRPILAFHLLCKAGLILAIPLVVTNKYAQTPYHYTDSVLTTYFLKSAFQNSNYILINIISYL